MDNIISKYFRSLTELQKQQYSALGELYPEWNAKINVISRQDIGNLYVNHVLHSLAIAKFFTPTDGTRFLDMGTGGGFPGIPLAIMFPGCTFHLIDRIGKKIRVAQAVIDAIGLKNAVALHRNVIEEKGKYDFVVSRAVMQTDELMRLVRKNIQKGGQNALPNGLICLKGGDLHAELLPFKKQAETWDLASVFDDPFFETKKVVYVCCP